MRILNKNNNKNEITKLINNPVVINMSWLNIAYQEKLIMSNEM